MSWPTAQATTWRPPLIVSFARGLAERGYPVLRFNFLYADQGRKSPDSQQVLEETWQAALRLAREKLGGKASRWVAAGKSMGGRIASQLASRGALPVEGLIFLGYPLHPAGDKEKLRDGHLYAISLPMLFFAGTRDALCDTARLSSVLKRLKAPWELETIEGGDHSFHVPKSMGRTEEQIFGRIVERSVEWLDSRFGSAG